MGNGMNKIISGVYVGNFRDAKDVVQLTDNGITHILSIHDNAKALLDDKEYLCIIASDTPDQCLTQHFPECIDFIHCARLKGGRVLIHCLAGISRSVTVTAAYIMTVTNLGWRDAVNCIRGARSCANPNFGFQKQLQDYENEGLKEAREKLKEKYPDSVFDDARDCEINLKSFRNYLQTGQTALGTELYSLPHRAYGERSRPCQKLPTVGSGAHKTDSGNITAQSGTGTKKAVDTDGDPGDSNSNSAGFSQSDVQNGCERFDCADLKQSLTVESTASEQHS
ncbi:dual specificity protein phosphatase 22-like [Dreissena polymorpha]|uniref:Dual specificity protein phosphatase 15 n=1 Tax=Dreissena polymorpha TaxID=45954 RepID=A0A9D4JDI0_DREPO|nr:dual specificity protein phosphatase 22-like [Dreissena polymorpha]XP_052217704.1 dual specificity protein phosphatase 22-like [Dreissena polymorpha]XP_052217705.1 dual specificity protein phosphatase 22-like [Dreissena polymorpha]KAH3808941.1 hypothetical protein DPMN_137303 [Dreissena polymorpha]